MTERDDWKDNRDPGSITRALNLGGSEAERALERIYAEVRSMARAHLSREEAGGSGTISPTVLVHEAWLKLADAEWDSRAHFFGAAARAMRQVLVDEARTRKAVKRGGGKTPLTLLTVTDGDQPEPIDLLILDEALQDLEQNDPRAARVVEYRFFGGLEMNEIAGLLDVSERTAAREWQHARVWLYHRLNGA